jgi:large subunit ribosomal protein L29
MATIDDFRGKSNDELRDMAMALKKELFNLRFQVASGELKNTARFRIVRRDVARVKTLLNEPQDAVKKTASVKPKKEKVAKAPAEAKAKKTTKKKASGE